MRKKGHLLKDQKKLIFISRKSVYFVLKNAVKKRKNKKSLHRRQMVSRVMTLDFGKNVKVIVVGVQCLVAEARYHRSCSAKFFSVKKAALKSIRQTWTL